MKLLSIEKWDNEGYCGYVEDGSNYKRFCLLKGSDPTIGFMYQKKDYRDYEHFAGVIGKFDPESFFLAKPIPLEDLSIPALDKACELLPEGWLTEEED
jgi:hypothetical protein